MSGRRWAALAGLAAALALYTAGADRLWDASLWPDLIFLTGVLFPATFALIWLLLPLRDHRGDAAGRARRSSALAVLLHFTELDVLNNFAKLFALVCLGFWFLSWFENVMWAALIAVVIPWVDAISVWRGPTEYVVEQQPQVFDNVSIAFRVPGEDSTANLGPPDILFFSLFLAAADRFGLRVAWTWLAMTALLGATLIVTATTDVAGLPALPAICIGFLLPNADILWTALRRRGRAPGRIYGRAVADFYDLDADVIERTPSADRPAHARAPAADCGRRGGTAHARRGRRGRGGRARPPERRRRRPARRDRAQRPPGAARRGRGQGRAPEARTALAFRRWTTSTAPFGGRSTTRASTSRSSSSGRRTARRAVRS